MKTRISPRRKSSRSDATKLSLELKKSVEFEHIKFQNGELKKHLANALTDLLNATDHGLELSDESKEEITEAVEFLQKIGGQSFNLNSYKNF